MSLSLRKLEALSAVAEAGSFAGAARLMQLTQPGVSQLIRALEDEYGVVLFTRDKGRLLLGLQHSLKILISLT